MKNIITNENGVVTDVYADGEVFIIPNHAAKLDEFCLDSIKEKLRNNAVLSVSNFNEESDWFVETWMVSDDLGSDNLNDHGCDLTDNLYLLPGTITRYIVKQALPIAEGTSTMITIPVDCYVADEDQNNVVRKRFNFDAPTQKVNLHLNLTAAQEKYRYRRFGRFEEVLERVCR